MQASQCDTIENFRKFQKNSKFQKKSKFSEFQKCHIFQSFAKFSNISKFSKILKISKICFFSKISKSPSAGRKSPSAGRNSIGYLKLLHVSYLNALSLVIHANMSRYIEITHCRVKITNCRAKITHCRTKINRLSQAASCIISECIFTGSTF